MELYNSQREKVEIADKFCKTSMSHGYFGSVYRYGENDCLKLCNRKDSMLDEQYLSLEVYTILNYLKSNNIVNIKEVYFKDLDSYPKVYGYLMPFYRKSNIGVLDMPKEYLINNLVELLTVARRCSELGIWFNDLKIDNTICTKDRMILIDPDFWEFDIQCSEEVLSKANMCEVKELIYEIICRELLTNYRELLYKGKINAFDLARELMPAGEPERAPEVVSKVLKKYDSPHDYVMRRTKSRR